MNTDLGEIIYGLGPVARIVHDYIGDTEIILAFPGTDRLKRASIACGRDGDALAYKSLSGLLDVEIVNLEAIRHHQNDFAMLVLDSGDNYPSDPPATAKTILSSRNEKYISGLSHHRRSGYTWFIYYDMLSLISMDDLDTARWCLQINTIHADRKRDTYRRFRYSQSSCEKLLAIARKVLDDVSFNGLAVALTLAV